MAVRRRLREDSTVVDNKSEGQGDMSILSQGAQGQGKDQKGEGSQGIPDTLVNKQLRW